MAYTVKRFVFGQNKHENIYNQKTTKSRAITKKKGGNVMLVFTKANKKGTRIEKNKQKRSNNKKNVKMKRYSNFGFGQKQTKMGKPLKAEQKKYGFNSVTVDLNVTFSRICRINISDLKKNYSNENHKNNELNN